ncbi:glycosyltransferase family 2 protein [Leuconostoc citreum]|uniref:glycosyltransferase family 2 protein n=1 Tax=Leuconostoc citreum TaxID=33964 RepID=UPI0011BB1905|nr:glycosyltransferase [Leuconostoc citreum]KAF0261007.1 hypothetical protein CRI81_02185 [Leuconostoc citreum]MCT3068572.1 glycosyltransferase [Leuconostoc citreum]QEA55457.1 glycosyltransferase [Leuconostoc citreum]
MSIKFSIIMPVYNVGKFLNEAIRSVVNQTYENLELIIVNDGSTDNSEEVVKKFSQIDNRIVLINQINMGLSAARNVGLTHVTGDYIFFMDSDDIININLFSIVYGKICQTDSSSVFMIGYDKFSEKKFVSGEKLQSKKYASDELVHNILIHRAENYVWQFIISKSIFNEELLFLTNTLFEDIDWTARFLSSVKTIDYISESLYYYRTRLNSITHTRSHKKANDLLVVLNSLSKTINTKFPKEKANFDLWRKPLDITVYCDYSLLGWGDQVKREQLFHQIYSYNGEGLSLKQKLKLYLIKIRIIDILGNLIGTKGLIQ